AEAAQRAAGVDDRRRGPPGAARQLRAERPARQRPRPGAPDAPGAPAADPLAEERGDLDRALEYLPSDTEIDRRFADGLGLKSPEFSVLVAYAKLALKEDL